MTGEHPLSALGGQARWELVQELFHAAAELEPGSRDEFLVRSCGDDVVLRRELEGLIASLDEPDSLTDAVREESKRVFDGPAGWQAGGQIGPYRVERLVGRGGMGNVYAGFRDDGQFRQQVAIKLVRPDVVEAEVLRRFRAERQILADLDHPNIARLLDGGVTGPGLPYLVMEFVDGEPLDQFCRARGLTIAERLGLFRSVCSAVQYAHHRLVVHRDLKPSNILVTADGTVKLLDFGIAKLLEPDGNAPAVTKLAERPMTLDYASPEQVRGEATTTATDVFALGTLLYELLSGARPYKTRDTHPVEAQRRICEEVPPRPSSHNRLVSHELDDIVAMAIRKEPEKRYGTVEKFSADIQNYLDGFPVAAAKGNSRYRTMKFIRRHPAAVGTAAGAVILLVGFAAAMGVLAVSYARERDMARMQSARAEQVAGFLTGLFQASDPFKSRGKTITARELLDTGAQRVTHDLQAQPAVRTKVLVVIGQAYEHLSIYDRAEEMYAAEVRDARSAFGAKSIETAQGLRNLGEIQRQESKLTEAETSLRESLATLDSLKGSDTWEKANIVNDLALVLQDEGKPAECEAMFRHAVELAQMNTKDAGDLLAMKSNLGSALADLGRYGEAEAILRGVLRDRRELLGNNHAQVFRSMQRLASLLYWEGSYAEAEKFAREAIADYRRMLGDEHADVLLTTEVLALILQDTGKWEEAERLYRQTLAVAARASSASQLRLALWKANLGSLLTEKGELAEASGLLRESLATARSAIGTTWRYTPQVLSRYGRLLVAQGSYGDAEPLFAEELAWQVKAHGAEHPATAEAYFDVGTVRERQGRCSEALALYRHALDIDRKLLKPGHAQTAAHASAYERAMKRCTG